MAAQTYASALMQQCICRICEEENFTAVESGVLDVLMHVTIKYIEGVATAAKQLAELAGRSKVNLVDVRNALTRSGAAFKLPFSGDLFNSIDTIDERDATDETMCPPPKFPVPVWSGPRDVEWPLGNQDSIDGQTQRPGNIPAFLPPLPPNVAREGSIQKGENKLPGVSTSTTRAQTPTVDRKAREALSEALRELTVTLEATAPTSQSAASLVPPRNVTAENLNTNSSTRRQSVTAPNNSQRQSTRVAQVLEEEEQEISSSSRSVSPSPKRVRIHPKMQLRLR